MVSFFLFSHADEENYSSDGTLDVLTYSSILVVHRHMRSRSDKKVEDGWRFPGKERKMEREGKVVWKLFLLGDVVQVQHICWLKKVTECVFIYDSRIWFEYLLLSYVSVWKWVIHHRSSEWQERNPFTEHYAFSISPLGINRETKRGKKIGEREMERERWRRELEESYSVTGSSELSPNLWFPFLNVHTYDIQREGKREEEALNETSFYRCYIINYILIQQLRKQFSFTLPLVPWLFPLSR